MAGDDKATDYRAEESACPGDYGRNFVEGLAADDRYDCWAIDVLSGTNMACCGLNDRAGVEVILSRYEMYRERLHGYELYVLRSKKESKTREV